MNKYKMDAVEIVIASLVGLLLVGSLWLLWVATYLL